MPYVYADDAVCVVDVAITRTMSPCGCLLPSKGLSAFRQLSKISNKTDFSIKTDLVAIAIHRCGQDAATTSKGRH